MSTKRYSYRAYPTAGQRRSLSRLFGCVRVVYNDVISLRESQYKSGLPFASATLIQAKLAKRVA